MASSLEKLRRRYPRAQDFQTQHRRGLEVVKIKQGEEERYIYFTEEPSEKTFLLTGFLLNHLQQGVPLVKFDELPYALGLVVVQGKVKQVLASPIFETLISQLQPAFRDHQPCMDQFVNYLP